MFNLMLLTISTCLALISPIIYSIEIIRGNARPHRTTRLVLLIITSLSTVSLLAQGNKTAVWLAFASMLQSTVIFLLSLKYGMGGKSGFDILCLLIAFLGIILWQVTRNPIFGLVFSVFADFIGMVPAILKTYRQPETEVWLFFALDTIAALLNLLVVSNYTFSEVLFPVYIFVINLVMVFLALRKQEI
ncbi:hypothetical protein GF362_04695 [Candidatus Dojkabacteria bacterium]|nr:hypothetical protein [Candidatus Dojkabacteria bacterium]